MDVSSLNALLQLLLYKLIYYQQFSWVQLISFSYVCSCEMEGVFLRFLGGIVILWKLLKVDSYGFFTCSAYSAFQVFLTPNGKSILHA